MSPDSTGINREDTVRDQPRVLFLNAPIQRTTLVRDVSIIPLGQLSIASNIQDIARVKIADTSKLSLEELEELIEDFGPHHLGMTLYDRLLTETKALLFRIKERFPRIIISLGGPMATLFPEISLRQCKADAVFTGEAEESYRKFVKASGTDARFRSRPDIMQELKTIPGLYLLDQKGSLLGNAQRPSFTAEELEKLPLDFTLVRDMLRADSYQLCTSRGCPYRCIFCTKVHGNTFRAWGAQRVASALEEIQALSCQGLLPPVKSIVFNDDDFPHDRDRVLDLVKLIHEKKLTFRYHFQSNINSFIRKGRIDSELIDAVSSIDLWGIRFGTESFNEEELKKLHKPYRSIERITTLIEAFHRKSVLTVHYLILSNFETSLGDFLDGLFTASEMYLKYNCRFEVNHYLVPCPGSPLMTYVMEKNIPFYFRLESVDGYPDCDYPVNMTADVRNRVVRNTLHEFRRRESEKPGLDRNNPTLYLPLARKHLLREIRRKRETGTKDDELQELTAALHLWQSRYRALAPLVAQVRGKLSGTVI